MISQNLLLLPLSILTINNIKPVQPKKANVPYKQTITCRPTIENWVANSNNDYGPNPGSNTINQWTKENYITAKSVPGMIIEQRTMQYYRVPNQITQQFQNYSTVAIATRITVTAEITNFNFEEFGWANIPQGNQSLSMNNEYTYNFQVNTDLTSLQENWYDLYFDREITNGITAYNTIYGMATQKVYTGIGGTFGKTQFDTLPPNNAIQNVIPQTLQENKVYYISETYKQYYNDQNLANVSRKYVMDSFSNIYTKTTLNYYALLPEQTGEIVNIPDLLFTVLTLPFAFLSQAFNLTLFPNTLYEVNVSNIFISIIGISILIVIIRIIFTLKG